MIVREEVVGRTQPRGCPLATEGVSDSGRCDQGKRSSLRNRQNPKNPSSPPRLVTLGEQTTNEMCFGFIGATTNDGKPLGIRFSPTGFAIRRPGLLPPRKE